MRADTDKFNFTMNHLFRKEELTLYLLATFFAVCACKVLMVIHFANWDGLAAAAYGVIEGRPHWIAFQNRLMGPYTVLLISKAGISFKLALALYHAVFLEILVILIIFLLRREGVSRRESALYLVFSCSSSSRINTIGFTRGTAST